MRKKNSDSNLPFESSDRNSCDLDALMAEFERDFPTDQACLRELFRMLGIDNELCQSCGSRNIEKAESNRSGHCLSCKETTWFTAGTILEKTKKSKPRLAKIFLERRGVTLSSPAFGKLLKIAQSSAHGIKIWFGRVIENFLPDDATSFQSSLFSAVICKRSLQTPALVHPRAEIYEIERTQALEDHSNVSFESSSQANSLTQSTFKDDLPLAENSVPNDSVYEEERHPLLLETNQQNVLQLLSKTPLRFDTLLELFHLPTEKLSAALSILEIYGKAERLAGDAYICCSPKPKMAPLNKESLTRIEAFVQFVSTTYHGISRKFLQAYAAAFWYRANPPNSSTRAYLSPALVKLPS